MISKEQISELSKKLPLRVIVSGGDSVMIGNNAVLESITHKLKEGSNEKHDLLNLIWLNQSGDAIHYGSIRQSDIASLFLDTTYAKIEYTGNMAKTGKARREPNYSSMFLGLDADTISRLQAFEREQYKKYNAILEKYEIKP